MDFPAVIWWPVLCFQNGGGAVCSLLSEIESFLSVKQIVVEEYAVKRHWMTKMSAT